MVPVELRDLLCLSFIQYDRVSPRHSENPAGYIKVRCQNPMRRSRAAVLHSLLEYELPIEPTLAELSAFGWDVEKPSLLLSSAHIEKILERYLAGELAAGQVTDWADLVECREDIGTAENGERLSAVIFRLANPNLNEVVNPILARELLEELRQPPAAADFKR